MKRERKNTKKVFIDFGNVMTGVTDPNFELNTDVNINDQTFQEYIFDSIDSLTQNI